MTKFIFYRPPRAAGGANRPCGIASNHVLWIITDRAIPHNSKCRYGERGAAAAKPKAQIILCVLSSILATQMPCRTPSRSEALRSATAACGGSWRGDPPERCLSRKAGIVRCCLKYTQTKIAPIRLRLRMGAWGIGLCEEESCSRITVAAP